MLLPMLFLFLVTHAVAVDGVISAVAGVIVVSSDRSSCSDSVLL